MESDKIERLLDKYFEATTTVAEEKELRSYFSGKNVASHLEKYAPMFQFFTETKEERYTKQVPLPKAESPTKALYKWVSIAAAVVLFVGLYFGQRSTSPSPSLESEFTQEEIASAQEAMALLAQNFSKGTQQLSYLEEFEKNTNKFLIK